MNYDDFAAIIFISTVSSIGFSLLFRVWKLRDYVKTHYVETYEIKPSYYESEFESCWFEEGISSNEIDQLMKEGEKLLNDNKRS